MTSPLLQLLAFFFGCWEDHGEVGTVHLKEDGIFFPDLVGQIAGVNQLLVLVIGVVVLEKIEIKMDFVFCFALFCFVF